MWTPKVKRVSKGKQGEASDDERMEGEEEGEEKEEEEGEEVRGV